MGLRHVHGDRYIPRTRPDVRVNSVLLYAAGCGIRWLHVDCNHDECNRDSDHYSICHGHNNELFHHHRHTDSTG